MSASGARAGEKSGHSVLARKIHIVFAVLLTFLAVCVDHRTQAQSIPNVDTINAHLFYEKSGTFSDNIASPSQFHGWNTPIGEGDAKEPANDILVKIYLSAGNGKETFTKTPLFFECNDRNTGKWLVRRAFRTLLFGNDGRLVKAVWLPDVTLQRVTD
jgi:hypothetical protein